MTQTGFKRIDHDYAVNSIKAQLGPSTKRVIYCSSFGTSLNSPFLYPKSKAETERDIAKLGAKETIIFRPAFLTQRDDGKLAERIFGPIVHYTWGQLSANADVPVAIVGTALAKAGILGVAGLKAKGLGVTEHLGKDGPEAYTLDTAAIKKLAALDL